MKNVNIANITVDFEGLINKWIEYTYPFHKLPIFEQKVIAGLLIQYFKYKEKIEDDSIVWKMVFDYSTKCEIRDKLQMKEANMNNILTSLRKKKILKNNMLIKSFIPNIDIDTKEFKLVYNFKVKDVK
jgi:hypothetical protein